MLFLGSGISFPSELPNVNQITVSLLNDEWFNHSDLTFVRGEHPSEYFRKQNFVPRLQLFLKILKEFSDSFYQKRNQNSASYEDLFYLCKQIDDHESGEVDNPGLIPFIDFLNSKIVDICKPIPSKPEFKIDLKVLANRSCDFIQNVVWNSLSTNKEPVGMELIVELAKLNRIDKLDIVTLNHDLLLEKLLSNNDLPFIDGFDSPDGEVRYFNPVLYSNNNKINFYKLHGSINWYRFRNYDKKRNITMDRYGMAIGNDLWHTKDSTGNMLDIIDIHPIFLTGSYNKLSSYNFGIFRFLNCKFDEAIANHNIIIMSGYGWNDKGVNGRLMQWIKSSLKNKIVLLHRNPIEQIKKRSKSPMWHSYDGLVKEGRLVPIEKWLSEAGFADISDYL